MQDEQTNVSKRTLRLSAAYLATAMSAISSTVSRLLNKIEMGCKMDADVECFDTPSAVIYRCADVLAKTHGSRLRDSQPVNKSGVKVPTSRTEATRFLESGKSLLTAFFAVNLLLRLVVTAYGSAPSCDPEATLIIPGLAYEDITRQSA